MDYKEGEFYIILDEKNYKSNKFIGEIKKKVGNNSYLLYTYIFPEDTKDGRQNYMSSYEVFLTPTQTLYKFEGFELKVEVVSIEEYINRKYLNSEHLQYPLYYNRQQYCLKSNKFDPEILPLVCYCQQIFNPDIPFKKCKCGNIFHQECLLQSKSNKCWAFECDVNCNTLLCEEEQVQKATLLSQDMKEVNLINDNITESNLNYDNYNINNIINENNFLNRKTNREKDDNNKPKIDIIPPKISIDNKNNLNELNNQNEEKERKIQIIGVSKNKENNINREKSQNLIYEILSTGLIRLQNNKKLLEKYKDKELYNLILSDDISVLLKLKELSEKIEENLYNLYQNKESSYYNFLQDFHKSSFDLIIRIILGEFTPEQISKFTEDDFLSEEQKKEKEKKKKNEYNKMVIKNDSVKLTLNKGRMLSEQEIFYDEKNNNDAYMINDKEEDDGMYDSEKVKKYKEKIEKKQKEFPNMKIDDIKMLIDLTSPNEDDIKKKLFDLIQDNLGLDEQSNFFEKRNELLKKEAKKILNIKEKEKKKKNEEKNILGKNLNSNEDKKYKNDENDAGVENVIQNISFDMNYFKIN